MHLHLYILAMASAIGAIPLNTEQPEHLIEIHSEASPYWNSIIRKSAAPEPQQDPAVIAASYAAYSSAMSQWLATQRPAGVTDVPAQATQAPATASVPTAYGWSPGNYQASMSAWVATQLPAGLEPARSGPASAPAPVDSVPAAVPLNPIVATPIALGPAPVSEAPPAAAVPSPATHASPNVALPADTVPLPANTPPPAASPPAAAFPPASPPAATPAAPAPAPTTPATPPVPAPLPASKPASAPADLGFLGAGFAMLKSKPQATQTPAASPTPATASPAPASLTPAAGTSLPATPPSIASPPPALSTPPAAIPTPASSYTSVITPTDLRFLDGLGRSMLATGSSSTTLAPASKPVVTPSNLDFLNLAFHAPSTTTRTVTGTEVVMYTIGHSDSYTTIRPDKLDDPSGAVDAAHPLVTEWVASNSFVQAWGNTGTLLAGVNFPNFNIYGGTTCPYAEHLSEMGTATGWWHPEMLDWSERNADPCHGIMKEDADGGDMPSISFGDDHTTPPRWDLSIERESLYTVRIDNTNFFFRRGGETRVEIDGYGASMVTVQRTGVASVPAEATPL